MQFSILGILVFWLAACVGMLSLIASFVFWDWQWFWESTDGWRLAALVMCLGGGSRA